MRGITLFTYGGCYSRLWPKFVTEYCEIEMKERAVSNCLLEAETRPTSFAAFSDSIFLLAFE
jgi:hypothetical protein